MNNKWFKYLYQVAVKAILYIYLTGGAVIMAGPFLWAFSTSLKDGKLIRQMPPKLIPDPVVWENYARVWNENNFLGYTLNSIIITFFVVAGTILSCSFVGFGLARLKFKGQNFVFIAAVATLIMPYQTLMIPQYFVWKQFDVLDSYLPLILPAWFGNAFGIFLMRQFFKSLPGELYEVATIDGCNPIQIYWIIYLPLAAPALASLMVFTFIGSWNDILHPLIYITTKVKYPLSIGLLYLKGQYVFNLELIMAGAIIMMIPVIAIYLAAQKYFVQGIATSGLKG